MLAHLGRTRCTVQADHVDTQRLEGGQRSANFRTHQHGSGGFHRDLDEDGQLDAFFFDGLLAAVDSRLGLEQILRSLNQKSICTTANQANGLLSKGCLEVGIGGVTKAGELGARAHRAEHPPHASVLCFKLLSTGTGNLSTCLSKFGDAIFDAVVTQVGPVRTERIGFNTVDTGFEVCIMHCFDDVRTADIQNLITTLELLEVVQARIVVLKHGAHSAIGNNNALSERVH